MSFCSLCAISAPLSVGVCVCVSACMGWCFLSRIKDFHFYVFLSHLFSVCFGPLPPPQEKKKRRGKSMFQIFMVIFIFFSYFCPLLPVSSHLSWFLVFLCVLFGFFFVFFAFSLFSVCKTILFELKEKEYVAVHKHFLDLFNTQCCCCCFCCYYYCYCYYLCDTF